MFLSKNLRAWLVLLIIGGMMIPFVAAQDTADQRLGVRVRTNSDTDQYYPQIKLFASVLNQDSGRFINELTSDQFQATLNGTPLEIAAVEQNTGVDYPVHLAIVLDETSSVSQTFMDEQKRTALQLIDGLNVNDQVAIVTFDTNEADVPWELNLDHGGAANTVESLQIVQGPINQFRDGIQRALETLQINSTDPNARRAVVVMTDVQDPKGTATAAQSIALANEINAPIYLIGFNDAEVDFLREYSQPTGGFTYLQRELEQDEGLDRLAADVARVLTQQYVLELVADEPAADTSANVELTATVGGLSGTDSADIVTRSRTINISFPNLQGRDAVSDEVVFEPVIAYADNNETPTIVSAEYTINSGGLDETLVPPDASDPVYTWDLEEINGGRYTIGLNIVDAVGNEASGSAQVLVASPLSASFISPAPDPNAADDTVIVSPQSQQIQLQVESDYAINQVSLYLNNELIAEQDGSDSDIYSFEWDASSLTGMYVLRADVTDARGNAFQQEQAVQVSIGANPNNVMLIALLIGIIAILVIIGVILAVMRRRNQPEAMPEFIAAPDPIPESPTYGQPLPRLIVLTGDVNGVSSYPLQGSKMIVGRGKTSDIRVKGLTASRVHAEINQQNGGYNYRDLTPDKGNISIINGGQLRGTHHLQEGDVIRVGDTELRFTFQN